MEMTILTGAIQDAKFMANVTGNTYYVVGNRFDISITEDKPIKGDKRKVLEVCQPSKGV